MSYVDDPNAAEPSPLTRAVQLELDGRRFTFYVDEADDAQFWRVVVDGKIWRAPITFSGNEEPGFFQSLAASAVEHYGL